jgi:hypothetical protein
MKFQTKNFLCINYFLSIALAFFGFMQPSFSFAEVLITSKEAGLPPATQQVATRGISRGPAIKLITPVANTSVNSPFDFRVAFEPRGDSKIDVNSIKLTYLKSPYVDLTPRLKSTISANGINFPNAEVPAGEHSVQLSIRDTEGRETNSVLNLVVSK